MTRAMNARIAGVAFLAYIADGVLTMVLGQRSAAGVTLQAQMSSMASHQTLRGIAVLLALLQCALALVLGVTLRALTRDEDDDLATLAFSFRVVEGVLAALPITGLGLLWLATTTGADAPDPSTAGSIAALLAKIGTWKTIAAASMFAAGSAIFAWLFLHGRMAPRALAWLGLAASAVLVVALPLQLAGFVASAVVNYLWAPMAVFEIVFGVWLIWSGAPLPHEA